MKKIFTLLFTICIAAIASAQTVSTVAITHINGETVANFKSNRTNLVEGETLALTVNYKNIQANPAETATFPNPRVQVRVLNVYGVIPECINGTSDVTTSDDVQTVVINLTVPNVTGDIAEARLQALAYGTQPTTFNAGMVFGYAGPFTLNDLLPTAINDVKNELSSCYYASSKEAIIIGDKIEGDYSIYNLSGVVVLKGQIESEINVSSLSSGLYVLSVDGGVLKFSK